MVVGGRNQRLGGRMGDATHMFATAFNTISCLPWGTQGTEGTHIYSRALLALYTLLSQYLRALREGCACGLRPRVPRVPRSILWRYFGASVRMRLCVHSLAPFACRVGVAGRGVTQRYNVLDRSGSFQGVPASGRGEATNRGKVRVRPSQGGRDD